MRFLHDKTVNKPTESNLCLPNDTSHVSEKQNNAITITGLSQKTVQEKVTDAELLYQLKKSGCTT